MRETFKATHLLKKDWCYPGNSRETFRKGTPVYYRYGHRKHGGCCCNILILDKNGHIRNVGDHVVPLYDKNNFKPLKEWLEKI